MTRDRHLLMRDPTAPRQIRHPAGEFALSAALADASKRAVKGSERAPLFRSCRKPSPDALEAPRRAETTGPQPTLAINGRDQDGGKP
jgi:hypothetical protein